MPIEEKPQLLEFNCTIQGMEDTTWNIKYDPNDKIGLHISGNAQNFHCPIELFEEVTLFLRSKGISKSQVLTRTGPTSEVITVQAQGSVLPIPQVSGPNINTSVSEGPPSDPLSSFDINSNVLVDTSKKEVEKVVTGKIITSENESGIINRPVIRSRVNKDDPMSAEKEAAAARGVGAAGVAKTIKKRHKPE